VWYLGEPSGHETVDHAVVDGRAVAGEIGSFGDDIEAGEQGDAVVGNETHDMALAFFVHEFEGQEGADRLLGWDHGGAGKLGLADDLVEAQRAHQGDEDEEAAQAGTKRAWPQVEFTDVGDGGEFGPSDGRPLVVASAGQAGKAFFAEEHGQGIDAERMAGRGQLALNVVDR
jgi:hypothetical protein